MVADKPFITSECGRKVQLLAVELGQHELYHIATGADERGTMVYTGSGTWDVRTVQDAAGASLVLGAPDEVFLCAMGDSTPTDCSNAHTSADTTRIGGAAPHWPAELRARLAKRRASGCATVVFDAGWFLEALRTSPVDRPLLFPSAASKLGLGALQVVADVVQRTAISLRAGRCDVSENAFAEVLMRAYRTERAVLSLLQKRRKHRGTPTRKALGGLSPAKQSHRRPAAISWGGAGRLVGEYVSGELAQIGEEGIPDGCRAALGTGQIRVVFNPGEPLGLSLGPLQPAAQQREELAPGPHGGEAVAPPPRCSGTEAVGAVARGPRSPPINPPISPPISPSIGMGAEIGEVDSGGAAERAGVLPGMIFSRFESPDLQLATGGRPLVTFERVLDEIDARRGRGDSLRLVFDTAAPVERLYAVEMPARAAVSALALVEGREEVAGPEAELDLDVGAAIRSLCGPDVLLWTEETPRLFLGEAGSATCAHTDICPQLEFAHGLCGIKLLGVASHEATPRLSALHVSRDGTRDGDQGQGGDQGGAVGSGDGGVAGAEADVFATRVPVHRPLSEDREAALLLDPDVSILSLEPGDLAVFHSGALHFATNGVDYPTTGGLSGALYHGAVSRAVLPRLRAAAAAQKRGVRHVSSVEAESGWAAGRYMRPSDLLRQLSEL